MSLINEALKRAGSNPPANPPAAAAVTSDSAKGMKPVPSQSSVEGPPFGWIAAIVVLLAAGSWFLDRAWSAKTSTAATSGTPATVGNVKSTNQKPASSPSNPVVAAAPNPIKVTAREHPVSRVSNVRTASSSDVPPVRTTASVTPGSAPSPNSVGVAIDNSVLGPVPEPNLKLKAIFFNPRNPSAIINTKSVFKGDRVEGGRVKDIDRDRVLVDWHGREIELTLP